MSVFAGLEPNQPSIDEVHGCWYPQAIAVGKDVFAGSSKPA